MSDMTLEDIVRDCTAIIVCVVFFFNDTATTEIYTLSLHDALPISRVALEDQARDAGDLAEAPPCHLGGVEAGQHFVQQGVAGVIARQVGILRGLVPVAGGTLGDCRARPPPLRSTAPGPPPPSPPPPA